MMRYTTPPSCPEGASHSNPEHRPGIIDREMHKHLRTIVLLLITILFGTVTVHAQTQISRDIHNHKFTPSENPYIITDNIFIPSGTKCTIPAGCILLFQPFTGLNVEGTLVVNGTSNQPVIFSSANDSAGNSGAPQPAAPFDWNGIIIAAESNSTILNHASIRYSVYGIKSQTPNLTLSRCLFSQNGQYHFTVKEQIQNVLENFPFSYPDKPDLATHNISDKSKSHLRPILRIVTITAGIGGIAGGAYLAYRIKELNEKLNSIDPTKTDPKTGNYYTENDWNYYNDKRQLYFAGSVGGFVLGGLGVSGFVLTFVF